MTTTTATEDAPATEPGAPSTPAPSSDEVERRRALNRMKLVATGLLVLAAVVFVVARQFPHSTFAGYVEAFAEAAMVGALADWFAVTALFKHPLGLPIPHTAIIPERKDDIGRGLGTFVQGNFLSGPVIAEKIRSVGVAVRLGEYLAEPANARKIGDNAGDAVKAAVDALRDEDIAPVVEQMVTDRVQAVPAAPLAARVLEAAMVDGHHQLAIDSLLKGVDGYLDRNAGSLRDRLDEESPWWVPEAIDDRIFEKLVGAVRRFIDEVGGQPDHQVRLHFDERARELVDRLRHSPEMEARGEELKAQLLAHPALRTWTATLWQDLKVTLVEASADPASDLRARLEAGVIRLGETLQTDPDLQAKVDGWVERTAIYLLDQYRDEVADLISGTVERWDAGDASRRIELQVGRDLQFIRINGTVVGGLVGVLIHAATHVF
ncbi:MAG: DUF445 domain-containing protein [Acidimicrobiales bacterium]|nr:DUF445 domain-containing protein [Acidimicrobiales bacterium]